MDSLIVFDSKYGNTEKVARAIHERLAMVGEARIVSVGDAPHALTQVPGLVVVGGPTQRHGASPEMRSFLGSLPRRSLAGVRSAAFDTRYNMNSSLSGSAARRIAQALRRAGCSVSVKPESFFVSRDDPNAAEKRPPEAVELEPGELERAREWADSLILAVTSAHA